LAEKIILFCMLLAISLISFIQTSIDLRYNLKFDKSLDRHCIFAKLLVPSVSSLAFVLIIWIISYQANIIMFAVKAIIVLLSILLAIFLNYCIHILINSHAITNVQYNFTRFVELLKYSFILGLIIGIVGYQTNLIMFAIKTLILSGCIFFLIFKILT
jgi:hypothetical protein